MVHCENIPNAQSSDWSIVRIYPRVLQVAGADVSAAEAVGETEGCLARLVTLVHRVGGAQTLRVPTQLRAAGYASTLTLTLMCFVYRRVC